MSAMWRTVVAIGLSALMGGMAVAQTTAPSANMFADGKGQGKAVRLARLIINIRPGEVIGRARYAILCGHPEDMTWDAGSVDLNVNHFTPIFQAELQRAGFFVPAGSTRIFGNASEETSEYLVGGSINRLNMHVCYRGANQIQNSYEKSSGRASIDVEWQIYSQIERKVVATITTTGAVVREQGEKGGRFGMLFDAFAAAVRELVANQQFAKAFNAPMIDMAVARAPSSAVVPLSIKNGAAGPVAIKDAVASTAVIFANGGEGSGFLIGADGYVLTNHHVVGGAQYVKVRWSDGVEVLGEVIRSDKLRDVALVKADPKGRKPLALRSTPVAIGEDIYAIGAPTGEKFQNTVTKGIVSATRVFQGFNFIQSDVAVTHGNSGGPIVDSKGQVVGLTDLGFDDAPMLNLFIPIVEAQGFLGLQMN